MATTAIDTYIGSSTCYDRFRSLCKKFRLFGWAIRSDSAIDLPWDPELRKYCNVQIIAGKLRDKGRLLVDQGMRTPVPSQVGIIKQNPSCKNLLKNRKLEHMVKCWSRNQIRMFGAACGRAKMLDTREPEESGEVGNACFVSLINELLSLIMNLTVDTTTDKAKCARRAIISSTHYSRFKSGKCDMELYVPAGLDCQ